MSTRCNIAVYEDNKRIYEPTAILYRHWNGYPGAEHGESVGVLPDIMPVIRDFMEVRGDDPEYLAARILGAMLNQNPDEKYLGFGICNWFHSDIDYMYAVYPDRVQVYNATHGSNPNHYELMRDIPI